MIRFVGRVSRARAFARERVMDLFMLLLLLSDAIDGALAQITGEAGP